jgi:DNA-binding transcriptional LysR family regulator
MRPRVLDLNDFFYFVQVVDRGGFTAAGRMLRIHKSTLSHRMQRLTEPTGTVRCTAALATMQFAIRDILADFLVRHPRLNLFGGVTQ